MKIILMLGVFMLLFGAMAQAVDFTSIFNQASEQLVGQELIDPVGKLFGDERVNVYLKTSNDKIVVFSVVTKDKKVVSFEVEELSDSTVKVYTDEATLITIAESSNPSDALKAAVSAKKITYHGVGFFKKMKLGMLSMFIRMPQTPAANDDSLTTKPKEEKPKDTIPGETVVVKNEDAKSGVVESVKKEVEEVKKEDKKAEINDVKSTEKAKETKPLKKETVVTLTKNGFEPDVVTIKVGDTIKWVNNREGSLPKAMILGAMQCVKIKSGIFESGDSFSWTFDKAETCTIVDGIYTTQTGKVIVQK